MKNLLTLIEAVLVTGLLVYAAYMGNPYWVIFGFLCWIEIFRRILNE